MSRREPTKRCNGAGNGGICEGTSSSKNSSFARKSWPNKLPAKNGSDICCHETLKRNARPGLLNCNRLRRNGAGRPKAVVAAVAVATHGKCHRGHNHRRQTSNRSRQHARKPGPNKKNGSRQNASSSVSNGLSGLRWRLHRQKRKRPPSTSP